MSKYFFIYSNPLSVYFSSPVLLIKFLVHEISTLNNSVQFLWVPNYVGTTGNESSNKLVFTTKKLYTFLHQKFLFLICCLFTVNIYLIFSNLNGFPYYPIILRSIEVPCQSSFVAFVSLLTIDTQLLPIIDYDNIVILFFFLFFSYLL